MAQHVRGRGRSGVTWLEHAGEHKAPEFPPSFFLVCFSEKFRPGQGFRVKLPSSWEDKRMPLTFPSANLQNPCCTCAFRGQRENRPGSQLGPPARVSSCTSVTRSLLPRSCLEYGIISFLRAGKSPTRKGTSLLSSHIGLRLLSPEKLLRRVAAKAFLTSPSLPPHPHFLFNPLFPAPLQKTEIHQAPLVCI